MNKGAKYVGSSAVLLMAVTLAVHLSGAGASGEVWVPEKLVKELSAEVAKDAGSPADHTSAIFHVISGKISEANSVSKGLIDGGLQNMNKRTTHGLHNCVELLGYSIEEVEASLARLLQGGESSGVVGDLRTWLSAALTFQDTCLEGLMDMEDEEVEAKMRVALRSSLKLTEDILDVLHPAPAAGATLQEEDMIKSIHVGLVGELKPNVTVAVDGSGDFETINEALARVPRKSAQIYIIYVKTGIYREHVSVPGHVTNLAMIGDGSSKTVITGSKNAMMNLHTKDTATMEAIGDGFFMRDIKVENTAGPAKHQAVALRVQSDQAVFHRCTFDGFQDTLYAHANRQFFRDCTISGTVDFIFGNSQAVFQNCLIQVRRPMDGQSNTITAQGRRRRMSAGGTVLHNCTVAAHPDLLEAGTLVRTYLGRPWKEYSRTIYIQSELGAFIDPAGWLPWNDSSFALNTLFYAEVNNHGPGADTSRRVKWGGIRNVTYQEAQNDFTVNAFINGQQFIPNYGVPFIPSLLPRS